MYPDDWANITLAGQKITPKLISSLSVTATI